MMKGISSDMVKANNDAAVWLIEGYEASAASAGVAGTANTGGGGGGSGSSAGPAQAGGSGIVVVRYAV